MTLINKMITKAGLSFECKLSEAAAEKHVCLDIVSLAKETSLCMNLDDFFCFADFVENTRARLLRSQA